MKIIDGHVHMMGRTTPEKLAASADACDVGPFAIMAVQDPANGSGLPEALWMKAQYPDRAYIFAGLNHAAELSRGAVRAPGFREQLDAYVALGCEGIKLLEGKPDCRRQLSIPITDSYFTGFWEHVEELQLPIVWHVNDPEEFWDPDRIPGWAASRHWGYGPEDAQKEDLYAEVEEVLWRYPRLQVIFAHFYFLSADLPRAARFLEAHPHVNFDLAPGIEMLYNISRDPTAGREFFIRFADRIVFGTDLMNIMTVAEGSARIGMVRRWLESGDEFRVSAASDFLLGPPEDGIIRGLSLPPEVLEKICRANFIRLAGAHPRPLHREAAGAHCRELAATAAAMSGKPAADTDAAWVAVQLSEQPNWTESDGSDRSDR